ncbi:MAG: DEAD/DEAH box helicase [Deltaproteobacteria bacterium]|nr:DEAD/DEAH box helicase [Deltaproteobacteria bacterium]
MTSINNFCKPPCCKDRLKVPAKRKKSAQAPSQTKDPETSPSPVTPAEERESDGRHGGQAELDPLKPGDGTWNISDFQVTAAEGKTRFQDLPLPLSVMHAIADLGFEYCTPIQAETLPSSLAGKDIVGQAQTGTGKTAAFLITLLVHLLTNKPAAGKQRLSMPRTLILAPTRELVIQIVKEAQELDKYCRLKVAGVYGGVDYQEQRLLLSSEAVDIMVATPGRLLDFQRQGIIKLKKLEIFVIDEADRMLDMGFIPDVRRIVSNAPDKEARQTILFSATISADVKRLASQWTKNAIQVEIAPEQVAVDSVEQIFYLTTAEEKYTLLYNVITTLDLKRVMVFVNRRDETKKLTDHLKRNGISCAMLSGEVPQKRRIATLEDFRNGKIRVLVATDVASRGIHIDGVSHVINYTLPFEPENYVHRIGRTGRAGAAGISISFACEEGSFHLPEIEEFLGRELKCVYPDSSLLVPPPRGTKAPGSTSRPGRKKRRPHPSGRRPKNRN